MDSETPTRRAQRDRPADGSCAQTAKPDRCDALGGLQTRYIIGALILLLTCPLAAQGLKRTKGYSAKPSRTAEPAAWQSYVQVRLSSPQGKNDHISLRRSKLIGRYGLARGLSARIQLLYKSGNGSATDEHLYLQDARLMQRWGATRLTLGVFKPPMGMERFTNDYRLDLVDRTQATDRLIPAGKLGESLARDLGLQIERTTGSGRVWWALGAFGGEGARGGFHCNGPLLCGWVTWRPPVSGTLDRLKLGIAAATRRDQDINFTGQLPGSRADGYDHFSGRDTRWNIQFAAAKSRWRSRAEYFSARYEADGSLRSRDASGWYLQLARDLTKRCTVAARVERFDPYDDHADHREVNLTTLGLTWRLRDYRRQVQLNYVTGHRGVDQRFSAWVVQLQYFP